MKTFAEAFNLVCSREGPRGEAAASTSAYGGVLNDAMEMMPTILERIAHPTIRVAIRLFPGNDEEQIYMLVYSAFCAGLTTGMEMEKHE